MISLCLIVFALVGVLPCALKDVGFSNVFFRFSIVLCCGVPRVSFRVVLLFWFPCVLESLYSTSPPGGNQVDGLPPAHSV